MFSLYSHALYSVSFADLRLLSRKCAGNMMSRVLLFLFGCSSWALGLPEESCSTSGGSDKKLERSGWTVTFVMMFFFCFLQLFFLDMPRQPRAIARHSQVL